MNINGFVTLLFLKVGVSKNSKVLSQANRYKRLQKVKGGSQSTLTLRNGCKQAQRITLTLEDVVHLPL